MNSINSFLFSGVNPRNLIIFRFLLACMIGFMFAPMGLKPIYPLTNFQDLIPYLFSTEYYVLIYILIALFAFGIKPRIVALLLFFILLPHDFLSEGRKSKQVILCVLLCFTFIRSIPLWKINQISYSSKEISPIWPIRLIQLQLTFLYGINAISKSSCHYLSGDALINMSVVYEQFHVNLSDGFLHFGTFQIPVFLLAISSVLIEYFLAVGLWFNKTKWIAVTVGVLFHLCLTFMLSIFMLDYVSVFLYLAFIIPFKLKK